MQAAAELGYRLLGPLEVRRGEERLQLGAAKQRALLAVLLVHRNRVVSTDELIEALWPAKPPARPQTAVQGYVSQLRKLLEPERVPEDPFAVLATEPPGYLLRVDPNQIDIHRFESLLKQGEQALAAGHVRSSASMLAEALSLFRGPPLADFTYEQWARQEIARIKELRLAANEARLDAELATGRAAELVGELEALVQSEPLRELPCGQLMLALYRSGRQAEALEAYHAARSRLVEELGLAPSEELQTLYRQILNHDRALIVEAAPQKPPTNLRAPGNRLIGRTRELEEIAKLLKRDEIRLVVLTGPGGTGKTHLALQIAEDVLEHFPDGVWFVSLAALTDPGLVLSTAATTLGAQEDLGDYLHSKEALLVLDSFEQVVEAAPQIADLLTTAPSLKMLVTSRERLSLSSEQEYPVSPLELADAVALFTERARQRRPSFEPDDRVGEICRRLDGLPLAVELAAARINVMTLEQILERLSRSLDLLKGDIRDAPLRQRTLRATIGWSYELLSEEDRKVFARLAVFAGGFDLDGAKQVVGADVDALQSLIDKSLLSRMESGRFFMLETIREYAMERFEARDDATELRLRHADWLVFLAEEAEPELKRAAQREWLDRLQAEQDNIRVALAWLEEVGDAERGLRLAAALWRFWRMRNHLVEGSQALETVLRLGRAGPATLQARALIGSSRLAMDRGDVERSLARGEEALAAAGVSGAARDIAAATENLGLMMLVVEDLARARTLLEDSIGRLRALGDLVGAADALNNLANALLVAGETINAAELGTEALALQRDAGNKLGIAFALHTLGYVALRDGDLELAVARFEECLVLFNGLGDLARVGDALEGLAHVATGHRDDRRAVVLWAAGESIRAEAGKEMERSEAALHEAALSLARTRMGEPAFALAWVDGAALAPKDAIAYAYPSSGNASGKKSVDPEGSR